MPSGDLPVASYLAVPVVSSSGEVLGGLFFGHDEPGKFEAETETLISAVAGQAAVEMDNARLHKAAEAEIEQRRRAESARPEAHTSAIQSLMSTSYAGRCLK